MVERTLGVHNYVHSYVYTIGTIGIIKSFWNKIRPRWTIVILCSLIIKRFRFRLRRIVRLGNLPKHLMFLSDSVNRLLLHCTRYPTVVNTSRLLRGERFFLLSGVRPVCNDVRQSGSRRLHRYLGSFTDFDVPKCLPFPRHASCCCTYHLAITHYDGDERFRQQVRRGERRSRPTLNALVCNIYNIYINNKRIYIHV